MVNKINTAKPGKPKKWNNNKNQNCLDRTLYDLKESVYYNYKKKGYFVKSCQKPLKN